MSKLLTTAFLTFFMTCLLTGCTKTCFLQEVNPFTQSPYGAEYGEGGYSGNRKAIGFARYQNLLKRLHHEGHCVEGAAGAGNVNAFKLRFCNYMLGYRNDNRDQLIAMAKEISEYYKKMRMYDMARTFDSYRDVLLFGNETIAESWDDTMDLLESFQAEIERRKKEEACRIEKERKKAQPSFWSRIFGSSETKTSIDPNSCNCKWEDSMLQAGDQVAIPRVILEPPGSCSPKNPLMFKRTPQYEACFGTGMQQVSNQTQQPTR